MNKNLEYISNNKNANELLLLPLVQNTFTTYYEMYQAINDIDRSCVG